MKAPVAQKAPGSDGGLFDAHAADIPLQFDEDAAPTSLADMFAEIDQEQADLDALRSCLPPAKETDQ